MAKTEEENIEVAFIRDKDSDKFIDDLDREQTTDKSHLFQPPEGPDGGWAWVVMVGSFFIHVNFGGLLYTTGVLYIHYKNAFKTGKAETALVSALYAAFVYCVSPAVSILCNRIGHRKTMLIGSVVAAIGFGSSAFSPNIYVLYLTTGVISGTGMSMVFTPNLVVLGYYFDKWRGVATGVSITGAGFGVIIYTYSLDYLIQSYGWRGSLIITSGFVLNNLIFSALFKPLPVEKMLRKQTKFLDLSVFKDVPCLFLLLSEFLWNVSMSLPWIIMPVQSKSCDSINSHASLILSIVGISGIFGRIVFALIGLCKSYNHFLGLGIFTLLNGLPMLFFTLTCNFWIMILIAIVFGFCMGYQYCGTYTVTIELAGSHKMTTIWGLMLFCDGVAWLCGPPIAGLIYEKTNRYFGAAVLGAIVSTISSIILISLSVYLKRKKKSPPR